MLIIVNCKLLMMLAKRWSISKLKKRGDAAPPIPSPQSTGHHDPVEAWRCCHATWQMQGSHPLGEPLVQPYGGVHRYRVQANCDATPIVAYSLSIVLQQASNFQGAFMPGRTTDLR